MEKVEVNMPELGKRFNLCEDCETESKEVDVYQSSRGNYFRVCPPCKKKRDKIEGEARLASLLLKIPVRYRTLKDEYGDVKLAKELKGEGVFLWGEVGSGKTVLATFILRELCKDIIDVRFVSYPELIYGLQIDYENSEELIKPIMRFPGCLFLDDFGAEKLTDFVCQISYLIINHREQNNLQTIITSNFSLDEIDETIDRRLSSRIFGMCRVINRKGDRRLEGKKK